ncbi:protein YIPF1 [Anoplophora glabripennis]|uniref:protein YIPF1 n=1 Tax=Anoplophora glabripennis TaxID=217634 RepID=UPI0008744E06|nr:protein YIPF1 [Anoplophora glabripennis]
MTNLQEVPTDELLSFHDYPTVHSVGNNTTIPISESQIKVNDLSGNFQQSPNNQGAGSAPNIGDNADPSTTKSFWTLEYYQKFFDVDTRDVVDRIFASITPKWDNSLKHHLRTKPDLYGPFWISVTLIFTIAISGNIANYLHYANTQYHWKYNFHLVSYAATTICLYVTLVPFILWGLLKWSSQINDIEGLEENVTPGALELICIYGYSLFIYIPVSVLWSIQINLLQWLLVLIAAFISGSVLLLTLMPALRLSRHKLLLMLGIISCHLLLAIGFMLYFFHDPNNVISTVAPHLAPKEVVVPIKPTNSS